MVQRTEIGLQLLRSPLIPALKIGATLATVHISGKTPLVSEEFNIRHRGWEIYSAASLTSLVGRLLGPLLFPGFIFLRYCNTCELLTDWNLMLADDSLLIFFWGHQNNFHI